MSSADILIRWGSDSTQAVRDMGRVNRALKDNMTTAQKWKRGITVASTVAFTALVAGGTAFVHAMKAASEDAKAQAVLVNTLKNTTGATQAQVDALNDYIKAAADATLYTDDELRPALGNLLRATGDQQKSQDLLNIAMDAATSTGKSVESVTTALGKAYGGNLSALKRLFPFLKDSTIESGNFAKAMKEIREKVNGASEAAANEDPWTILQQNLGELQETVGALGNTKGFKKLFAQINDALLAFTQWSEDNPDTLTKIGTGLVGIATGLILLRGALAISGAVKGAVAALKGLWAILAAIPNPIAAAAGWAAFEVMLDRWTAKKGGWARVISWLKDVADFLANPIGTGFEIGVKTAYEVLQTLVTWADKARAAIQKVLDVLGSLNPVGGKMAVPPAWSATAATAARTATTPSTVGRVAPVPPPTQVQVFIDGRHIPARTVTPATGPAHTALGVV